MSDKPIGTLLPAEEFEAKKQSALIQIGGLFSIVSARVINSGDIIRKKSAFAALGIPVSDLPKNYDHKAQTDALVTALLEKSHLLQNLTLSAEGTLTLHDKPLDEQSLKELGPLAQTLKIETIQHLSASAKHSLPQSAPTAEALSPLPADAETITFRNAGNGQIEKFTVTRPADFPDSIVLTSPSGQRHSQHFNSSYLAYIKAQQGKSERQDPVTWAKENNIGVYSQGETLSIYDTPLVIVEKEGQPRTYGQGDISARPLAGGHFGVIDPTAGFPLVDKGQEPISVYVTRAAYEAQKSGGYRGPVVIMDQRAPASEPFAGKYAEKKVIFGSLNDTKRHDSAKHLLGSTFAERIDGLQPHAAIEGTYYILTPEQYGKVRDLWRTDKAAADMSMQELIAKHGPVLGIGASVMQRPTIVAQNGDTLTGISDKFPALQSILGEADVAALRAKGALPKTGGASDKELGQFVFSWAAAYENGIHPDRIAAGREYQVPDEAAVKKSWVALVQATDTKSPYGKRITHAEMEENQNELTQALSGHRPRAAVSR